MSTGQSPSKVLKIQAQNPRSDQEHEECHMIRITHMPMKKLDSDSFIVPVHLANVLPKFALIDTSASVNIMPYSLFQKMNIGEESSTRTQLVMADQSRVRLRGKKDDIVIGVGKFTFLADFVLLDIDENQDIPLILGRPFLATSKAEIDFERGRLTLKVGDEEATFTSQGDMILPEMILPPPITIPPEATLEPSSPPHKRQNQD